MCVLLAVLAFRVVLAHFDALSARLPACAVAVPVEGDLKVTVVESGAVLLRVTGVMPVSLAGCASGRYQVRLSWPAHLGAPRVGDIWHVEARVRSPWSMRNPGGFDYERWLLANRIGATGYARHAELRVASPVGMLDQWRARLTKSLARAEAHPEVLKAVLLADGAGMEAQLWNRLRDSGTVHLLVVSGLHISVAAGVGAGLIGVLLRLFPRLCELLPRRHAMAVAGAGSALLYVFLAGPGVPVLRAFSSLLIALMFASAHRRCGSFRSLGLVLLLVLLAFPLAPLSDGFWLSFGAVTVLLICFADVRRAPHRASLPRAFLHAQRTMWIGMLPLLAATVGRWSVLSPVANALAVPLVSLFVVPPLLLHAAFLPVLDSLAGFLLQVADLGADWTIRWLGLIRWPALQLAAWPAYVWLVSGAAAIALLLPVPRQTKLAVLPALSVVLAPAGERLPPGAFRVTVLDVGQGSAALVETRSRTLLFDAGPRFPSGFDLGERVVLPALAQQPVRQLHRIVVSHSDLDHAGGVDAVKDAQPKVDVLGPDGSFPRSCHHAPPWQWDDVRFRFLTAPAIRGAQKDNNRSCTILVEAAGRRALLMGDTHAPLEMLIARQVDGPVDLLIAPHHGSATSSSLPLVRRLQPAVVAISSGRGNRYGHPHADVAARYEAHGSRVLVTHENGALQWRSDQPADVRRWREHAARYWTLRASM